MVSAAEIILFVKLGILTTYLRSFPLSRKIPVVSSHSRTPLSKNFPEILPLCSTISRDIHSSESYDENEIRWYDVNQFMVSPKEVMDIPLYLYEDETTFPFMDIPIHFGVEKDINMIDNIFKSNKIFGMVLSHQGQVAVVGTIIEVIRRDILEDKTQICWNKSISKFRILDIIRKEPYVVARVEFNIQDEDLLDEESCNPHVGSNKMSVLPESINEGKILIGLEELALDLWKSLEQVLQLTVHNINMHNEFSLDLEEVAARIYHNHEIQKRISNINSSGILKNSDDMESSPISFSSVNERFHDLTRFTYYVGDVICVENEDRQLLLQAKTVYERLQFLKSKIELSQRFLSSMLWEESFPVVSWSKKTGYQVSPGGMNE